MSASEILCSGYEHMCISRLFMGPVKFNSFLWKAVVRLLVLHPKTN